jgi:GGDEF domain-containing protein
MDLDNFKSINDGHGHLVGDECLIHVSQTLKSSSRSNDLVGRYGGDEVAALYPVHAEDAQLTDNELFMAIESKRQQIGGKSFFTTKEGENLSITISAGAFLYDAKELMNRYQMQFGTTITREKVSILMTSLLNRVDKLAYQSKQNGRNQLWVETATAPAHQYVSTPAV